VDFDVERFLVHVLRITSETKKANFYENENFLKI
jgi:hypothetical protein